MAGQIIKRGKRVWLVRVFRGCDPHTGKRRYHNHTVHGTKKDAERYRNGVIRDIDLGVFVEPSAMTLGEYLDKWVESAARPSVSQRTADGYEGLLKRYVRGPLGERPLSTLMPLDIQKVYGEMQLRGLSARVVRHTHSVLHSALKQALKWGMLYRNPTDLVELPRVARVEMQVLSPEEAGAFLNAASDMPFGLVFEFALVTGMRPEEYLALQWPDIDLGRGAATIQRVVVRRKRVWTFEEPKTSRSRRTVPLPSPLVGRLSEHKRKQAERRLKAGSKWEHHNMVFCGETGSPLSIPNLTYRYFRPILKQAGLPQIRLYDLRHTCATLLLMADENPKVVSERLGHSTIVLTLDTYSHVLPTMQQQATERLEKMLYGAVGTLTAHKA